MTIRIRFREVLILVTVTGLLFTVTNLVPISAVPSLVFLMMAPLIFFIDASWPPITKWTVAYYAISIASVLIYFPTSLLKFDFYRYDGNFIISFAPLLVLPLLKFRTNASRLLIFFVIAVTFVGVIAEPAIRLVGGHTELGLFSAPNAFGGFLMFTTAISFVWWRRSRKLVPLAAMIANLGLLYISYSRGSVLGLFLAIISAWLIQRRKAWAVALIIGLICLTEATILFFTYPIYVHSQNVMNLIAASADSTKEANIMIRALENWPRGLFAFFHSPIFGAGFGSVNDVPLHFNKEVSLFQMNTGGNHFFNSSHAHNTYIQILGEQGLFGFGVFLGFWTSIYKFIRTNVVEPFVSEVLEISFWSLTYASFTEHRIPSPSNALPFTLTLLLYYCATRHLLPMEDAVLGARGIDRIPTSARSLS